jgi:hypothetical protein
MSDPAYVALEQRIQRLERLVLPVHVDQALAVLAAATQASVFSAAELRRHAAVDASVRRLLERCESPRQVGKLLQRVAAAGPRGGVELIRVGYEHNYVLWQIRPVD